MKACKAVIISLLLLTAASANAAMYTWSTEITGDQERPNPTPSPAVGIGSGTYNDTTNMLDWVITFDPDELLAPETMAHFHQITNLTTRVGPPIINLPLGSPKTGSAMLTDTQETAFFAGLTYINIHSTLYPGGEIRGDITQDAISAVPEPSTVALGATGLLLMYAWRRRS
ncbi:MAG TPA: CHRD domain-containing protein [Bryobacteraceae bacterium]|nr:CHRD domain-containing protein [Bryobacteraceae bacterium]